MEMQSRAQHTLASVVWRPFRVGDIFQIQRGQRLIRREQRTGKIPYISSTEGNNGVDNFIDPPERMKRFKGILTIANSGSIGSTFFHPYEFVASDHVTCLANEQLNKYNALFVIPLLERLKEKYSFNREITNARIKNEVIILPALDDKPDWGFMEGFIKGYLDQIRDKTMKRISNMNQIKNEAQSMSLLAHRGLSDVCWSEFVMQDIFDSIVASPAAIDYINIPVEYKSNGWLPYVTRTAGNNGISSLVRDLTDIFMPPNAGNCLTIGLDTGTAHYQQYPFYTGQNIHVVRSKYLNRYTAAFLLPALHKSLEAFGWGGFSATLGRFRRSKIYLPDKNGAPDWAFMEEYMARVESTLLIKVSSLN